jgi:hypothetical protein
MVAFVSADEVEFHWPLYCDDEEEDDDDYFKVLS